MQMGLAIRGHFRVYPPINFLLKEIFEFDDARIQYAHHLRRDAHNT